jgi:hypothetical protein
MFERLREFLNSPQKRALHMLTAKRAGALVAWALRRSSVRCRYNGKRYRQTTQKLSRADYSLNPQHRTITQHLRILVPRSNARVGFVAVVSHRAVDDALIVSSRYAHRSQAGGQT